MKNAFVTLGLVVIGVACAVVLGYDEYCSTHPKQEKYLAFFGWAAAVCGLLLLARFFWCQLLLCNTR